MTDLYLETRDKIASAREAKIAELGAEVDRLRKLEGPLRDWLNMQSAWNSAALYSAAMRHFGIEPVIPD